MATAKSAAFVITIPTPEKTDAPAYGALELRFDDEDVPFPSPLVFSKKTSHVLIDVAKRERMITRNQEKHLRSQVERSFFPKAIQRWDRLFIMNTNFQMAIHRFRTICGLDAPEYGSGPARLEVCTDGACSNINFCRNLPRHARLYAANLRSSMRIIFSTQGARRALAAVIKSGLIDAKIERARILQQIAEAGLPDTSAARQADVFNRWGSGHSHEELDVFMPIILGMKKPDQDARFEICHDGSSPHAHLYYFNDRDAPIRTWNAYDAGLLLKEAYQAGIISGNQRRSLLAQFNTLGLPKGNAKESLFEEEKRLVRERAEIHVLFSRVASSFPPRFFS